MTERQFGRGRLVGLAIVAALTGIVVGWMSDDVRHVPTAGPPSTTSGALRQIGRRRMIGSDRGRLA